MIRYRNITVDTCMAGWIDFLLIGEHFYKRIGSNNVIIM